MRQQGEQMKFLL